MAQTSHDPCFADFSAPARKLGVLKRLDYTTNESANTEDTVAHGLGYIPTIFFVTPKERCAEVPYWSKAPDVTNVYLKCNTTGVACYLWVG
jgi:hypothetical protein